MNEVNYEGPMDADIYFLGEAPGAQEDEKRRPFVGGSGRILDRLLMDAGISRDKCRIGNLVKFRPPGNNFDWYKEEKNEEALYAGLKEVDEDIKKVKPKVIVPLGNHPLIFIQSLNKITLRRGSIYWNNTYNCKVIPTVHPASIMRNWDFSPLALFDFKRIKEESKFPEFKVPTRRIISNPSFEKGMQLLTELKNSNGVAFDIETSTSGEEGRKVMTMSCIGFSSSPTDALVIPFTHGNGEPCYRPEEEIALMRSVKELLEGDVKKIAQNAQFDMGFLEYYYGIKVRNLHIDTMCAMHTLYPELPKSLAVLCSLFTKHEYYKDMGKQGRGDAAFWKYNGLDACITYEAALGLEADMKEFNVWNFYNKCVHPLISVLLDMQLLGVKVDEEVRVKALEETQFTINKLQKEVNKLAGVEELNVSSPTQLKKLFFETMKLPLKLSRKTGRVSVDKDVIRELDAKHDSPIFALILSLRKLKKLTSTYLNAPRLEGRMHTSYTIGGRNNDKDEVISGPETGRLSSSKSIILHSGTNLQNIPHGICRRMFIPDLRKRLLKVDLSQAEARVVACLANEQKLIDIFNSKEDVFKSVAEWIFSTPVGSVTKDQRDIAKRMVHALNYGMGSLTFSVFARIPLARAKALIEKYFDTFHCIKEWQLSVEAGLGKSRIMTTPLGRKRQFFGRWGKPLFKEALAYVPQSTVGDILNIALVRTMAEVKRRGLDIQALLQVHDEFDVQYLPNDFQELKGILKNAFNIPIIINNHILNIPYKISVGDDWENLEELD